MSELAQKDEEIVVVLIHPVKKHIFSMIKPYDLY